jgi:hypothetical protein
MCFSLLKLYVTDIFQFDDMLIVATSTSKILINRKANQLPACVNVSYIPWKQQHRKMTIYKNQSR